MESGTGIFKTKKIYFSQVSNKALRDNKLSLKAKGLYSLIQSYITIEGFKLYKSMLENNCIEGEKSFDTAWKELKEAGYLKQEKKKVDNKFVYEYELLDEPFPYPHFGGVQKEGVQNRGVYNTISNNTDLNNTINKNNIDIFYKNEEEIVEEFEKTGYNKSVYTIVMLFYRKLFKLKKIRQGKLSKEKIKEIAHNLLSSINEYDLYEIEYWEEMLEEYFNSNRKYHSLQDFSGLKTLRILYERCK